MRKYDPDIYDGNPYDPPVDPDDGVIWTKQLGTSENDQAKDIAVDNTGNIYIVGGTNGSLEGVNQGSEDAFIRKYDSAGNPLWTDQFGTGASDRTHSVAVDNSGNVYITGVTDGDLAASNPGGNDIFIRKYNSSGTEQWTRQIGTSASEWGEDIAVDSSGNVYVIGDTFGSTFGTHAGGYNRDVFVVKYDTNGTQQWGDQFGNTSWNYGTGVAVSTSGYIYHRIYLRQPFQQDQQWRL